MSVSQEKTKTDSGQATFGAFEAQMLLESVVNAKNAVTLASGMVAKHDAMQMSLLTLVSEIESMKKQASLLIGYMERYVPEDPAAIEMARKIARGRSAPKGSAIAFGLKRAVLATKKASMEAGKSCNPDTLRELAESISALDAMML
jgi:hypothetical protein